MNLFKKQRNLTLKMVQRKPMQHKIVVLACLSLWLAACSGPGPKEFDSVDDPLYKLPVKTAWVARAGDIGKKQYKQLPIVFRGDTLYIATNGGDIGAMNPKTGKLLWQGHVETTITAGPEVDVEKGILYVANDNAEILAFTLKTLKPVWRVPVSSEVITSPVLAGDKLIVQSIDGKVSALSQKDGSAIWVESREVPSLTLRGTATPLLDGNTIITGFANGSVSALSLINGKTLWETSIAVARGRSDVERIVDVDGPLYQDQNLVYAAAMQGRIAAISKDNGQVVWTRDMSAYNGIVSDGKALFVSDAESKVWALDIKTGATLWRLDSLKGRDISTPAILGDAVVVGDGDGVLHWISRHDGELQTQVILNDVYQSAILIWGDESLEGRQPAITAEPMVYNGAVYVRDNVGALSVFVVEPKS